MPILKRVKMGPYFGSNKWVWSILYIAVMGTSIKFYTLSNVKVMKLTITLVNKDTW